MKTTEEIKNGLKTCSADVVYCQNSECPYYGSIYCMRHVFRDAHSCIQQLESTYCQLSKALCGKENATICEVLDAASQLKSRLAQVERERDEFAECIEKECEELRRPIESFVGMKVNAHYVSIRMASVLHRARWKHSDQKEKPSNQYGLYGKYTVIKNATGETVDDCFILRPNKDPVAQKAVLTYADITHDKQLANDLYKWIEAVKKDAKEDRNEQTST